MSAESAPEYRLYRLAALWGLPSASPSCVRVEVRKRGFPFGAQSGPSSETPTHALLMQAYLRLAKVNVAAEECVNASTSPSSMPAPEIALPKLSI